MAKQETDTQRKDDEFSRIFSEYHARIDEITRRTEKKLNSLNTEQDASTLVERFTEVRPEQQPEDRPEDRSEALLPPPVETRPDEPESVESDAVEIEPAEAVAPEAGEPEDEEPIEIEPEEPEDDFLKAITDQAYIDVDLHELNAAPIPESAQIIREAKRKAKKIVEEAEQKVKKEAKKKTQSQCDKLIQRARKEAEDIVNQTRQAAEAEKNDVITVSKQEAAQVIAEITEKCRLESQAKSSQSIAEARDKAQNIMTDVVNSSVEINRLITGIIDRAEQTVAEFEARLREETTNLASIITDTRAKLDEIATTAHQAEVQSAAPAPDEPPAEIDSPTLAVRLLGESSNGKDGTPALFKGQVEMKSSSAIDYQYLKNLKKYLVSIPDVKYLQEYASEKEMSVLFDIREPLPLQEVLRQVPLVEQIVPDDDGFIIVFANSG